MLSPDKRTALVIAHPGHELRVFRWLEVMQATVFVITDGSGRTGRSRLNSTTRILDRAGSRQGSFYGRLTDNAAYSAILNHNFALFIGLTRELARFLIDERVNYVAGDALEGYNPTHDVCRLVIDTAVAVANRCGGSKVASFDFPLTGTSDIYAGDDAIRLELDDDAFARKMAAARSYAELESEVDDAIDHNQPGAFRVECLRPVANQEIDFGPDDKPYYEQYGEKQVAAGHYRDVIRYREHFLPLAEALRQSVNEGIEFGSARSHHE
jgi:hypothetical protein